MEAPQEHAPDDAPEDDNLSRRASGFLRQTKAVSVRLKFEGFGDGSSSICVPRLSMQHLDAALPKCHPCPDLRIIYAWGAS